MQTLAFLTAFFTFLNTPAGQRLCDKVDGIEQRLAKLFDKAEAAIDKAKD